VPFVILQRLSVRLGCAGHRSRPGAALLVLGLLALRSRRLLWCRL